MLSNVPIVVRNFIFTAISEESIAVILATLLTTSKEAEMSKEEFKNEKLYQTTMHLARKMLTEGLISEDEYRQIDTIFLEKYRPTLGTLFSDIRLT